MIQPQEPRPTLDKELLTALVRCLPYGMEAVGHAQQHAVLTLLERRRTHRFRPLVDADTRAALRLLRTTAAAHLQMRAVQPDTGEPICSICPALWPCPIWEIATLLKVAPEATST